MNQNQISFEQLNLLPELLRAVQEQGFESATEIQSKTIPLIQNGCDVIGRSQTGTGKTLAFGIPVVERLDLTEEKPHVQALVLCPTRELAMQACDEIKKLAMFLPGVHTADIYGGAAMDRQIMKLKRANIVIGTPGRVMDHMRRRTLKLDHLKMIVLDEADEMLSMGFREDIETILQETPEGRQTILFSATMPSDILALTKLYQHDPQLIEIAKKQMTVENIRQLYYDVPMGRKMDALGLLLRYHTPHLALVFCNTKAMVDDITEKLTKQGFVAEGLHGDMKQSQRTKVMDSFKYGKTAILVATDVAARGIDVNDVDFVINYDIPQNSEYYVHRIGRTGRAGKDGCAITICSGRRQADQLEMIARFTRSKLERCDMPGKDAIREKSGEVRINAVRAFLADSPELSCTELVERLSEQGIPPEMVAAALLELHFGPLVPDFAELKAAPPRRREVGVDVGYSRIRLSIGRTSRVAPNHIVAAITERTSLSGRDIGKIEIYDDNCVVGVPTDSLKEALDAMDGGKICGKPITARAYETRNTREGAPSHGAPRAGAPHAGAPYQKRTHSAAEPRRDAPRREHSARPVEDEPKDYRAIAAKKRRKPKTN